MDLTHLDLVGLVGFNVLVSIASLALLSLGLGVIFGLMKIINLAHGEFLMLGAYTTVLTTNAGFSVSVLAHGGSNILAVAQ